MAAIGDLERKRFGLQFHPEVGHSPDGQAILRNFLIKICGCRPKWSAAAFIEDAVERIRTQVGGERVLLALSGGVDSAVAGALIHQAIGARLTCVFVDHGMLRQGEAEQVVAVFRRELGMNLVAVNAVENFLSTLNGITEPEAKRKTIGRLFVELFSEEARKLRNIRYLAQGTIYPDVIESAADSSSAQTIKSHHNVGGLPDDMQFELVEPLRDLFKDEVRQIGAALGLPRHHHLAAALPGARLGDTLPGQAHLGAAGEAARGRCHLHE